MVELFIANDLAEIHGVFCTKYTNYAQTSCDFMNVSHLQLFNKELGKPVWAYKVLLKWSE